MTKPMTSDSEEWGKWQIHAKSVCAGFCPFHNPSNHPLKDAPIHIRGDKMMLVERICEHGIGHDDPDSVAYFHSKGEMWAGTHGCDGCCGTKVTEEGSSTDDHANTKPSRELAPKAQSEAPSVEQLLDHLVQSVQEIPRLPKVDIKDHEGIKKSMEHYYSERAKWVELTASKINRLIVEQQINLLEDLPSGNWGILEKQDVTDKIEQLSNNLSKEKA